MSGSAPAPPLGVVIPCRNEAGSLPLLLAALQGAPALVGQVVVVDGGSSDGSAAAATLAGAQLLHTAANRGLQLGQGIAQLQQPWLLLLHADARLPAGWQRAVARAMASSDAGSGPAWWFDLAIGSRHPGLRLVEAAVKLRSHWRQLPYGDQGLLVGRELLERAGGIRPIPLMEDLELAGRLRQHTRLCSLGLPLQVSARRWRQHGVWQTTLDNMALRRAWRQGVDPARLASRYRRD